jgi:hypothetical protein
MPGPEDPSGEEELLVALYSRALGGGAVVKITNISRALGLPVSEGICMPAIAQAAWQNSAHKPVALLGRERGTGLLSEQPIVLPAVDDVPNYTTALSAHQVIRLLPTP